MLPARIVGRAALLGALLLAPGLGAEAGAAQDPGPSIAGWVVEDVWLDPVAGAEVILMDATFRELSRTLSDGEGRFDLPVLPGSYILQARLDGASSPPLGPFEVGPDVENAETGDRILQVPTPRALDVMRCLESEAALRSGVVLGITHEAGTGIALPGALVIARWPREPGDSVAAVQTVADAGGRYHLCGVPAGRTVDVRIQFMDQDLVAVQGLTLEGGAVIRADLPMDLGASESSGELTVADRRMEEDPGTVVGRLVDATTERPVSGALVRIADLTDLANTQRIVETDARGGFRFDGIGSGSHVIEIDHLAYGTQRVDVDLQPVSGVRLDLRVKPRALTLEGFNVRARRSVDAEALRRPLPMRAVAGRRLAVLDQQGATLMTAIREIGVGLRVREGNRPGQPCVESSRRATGLDPEIGCQMVVVVLDGAPVFDPSGTLADLRLADVESIEYLSPLEAGFRYGLEASARGALEIWTRGGGPYRSPERDGGG